MILDYYGGMDIRMKPEWLQFYAAIAVLVVGVLIYLLDRPSSSVYFVPDSWSMADRTPRIFGTIGRYLPTFAHTFAFILFTTAVMAPVGKKIMRDWPK